MSTIAQETPRAKIKSNLALVNFYIANNLSIANFSCFYKLIFNMNHLLDNKQPGVSNFFFVSQKSLLTSGLNLAARSRHDTTLSRDATRNALLFISFYLLLFRLFFYLFSNLFPLQYSLIVVNHKWDISDLIIEIEYNENICNCDAVEKIEM